MIFVHAVKVDHGLASHLVGPDPILRDQLIGFRFTEFSIAAPGSGAKELAIGQMAASLTNFRAAA